MSRLTILAVWLLVVMILAAAGGMAAPAQPAPLRAAEACDWSGVWLPFEGEWRLVQNGTSVSGSYLDGQGLVSGAVEGDVLRGQWREAPTYSPPFEAGHFAVTMLPDCGGFDGTWGLGDAECCNVLSAIRHDAPPPSLAVQVERGALVVDGQTIPAGATYFPPACPPPGRSPTEECASFLLDGPTGLKFSCFVNRLVRVMLVLDNVALEGEDSELLLQIIATQLREKCGLALVRQEEWALELAVAQGAAHVTGVAADQTIGVAAGPATARLTAPGSFMAGYDPAAATATFQTDAAPLGVQPQSAAAFTLPPYSRVEVTAGGPGPVSPLSRLYLPMHTR